MYMVFAALSYLKCDSVLILDACYSGYAADNLSDYIDEADYDHAVNVAVMSASSMDEESAEYLVENEDGDYESHGAFTLQVLSHLGWELSSRETTTVEVPFYTLSSDGSVTDIGTEKEVSGYTSFIPARQTASEFFSSVMEDWDDSDGQLRRAGRATTFSTSLLEPRCNWVDEKPGRHHIETGPERPQTCTVDYPVLYRTPDERTDSLIQCASLTQYCFYTGTFITYGLLMAMGSSFSFMFLF